MGLQRAVVAVIAALCALTACAVPSQVSPGTTSSPSAPRGQVESPFAVPDASEPVGPDTGRQDVSVADALAKWLGQRGLTYAGPCNETSLSDDIGKYCSAVSEDRGAAIVVKLGPTFSEFELWVLLERGPNGWGVAQVADMPAPDAPEEDFAPPF